MYENMLQALNQTLNQIMAQELGKPQASYRYYSDQRTKDMYFWTTEKILRSGKKRYISGIYRHYKTKKIWRVVESSQAGHAHRLGAKARAWKLYQAQV